MLVRPMDVDPEIDDILDKGSEALANGALDAARDALGRAEQIDALDREVLLFRASLLYAEEKLDEARSALDAVLEHHGDDPVALASVAGLLFDIEGDPEEVLPLVEEADALLEDIEVDPDDRDAARDMRVEVLTMIADWRLALGDRDGSSEAAGTATQLGPDHAGAWGAAGRAQLAQGRLAEARRALTTASTLDAEDAEIAFNLGWVERLSGDDTAAASSFARAARLAPDVFRAPATFTAEWLAQITREVATAYEAPLDALLRGVPVTVDEVPPVEVEGERAPTALLWLEGEVSEDLSPDERLNTKPTGIRVFRRNVEVVAHDGDTACEALQSALAAELAAYLGLEGVDEDEDEELAN